MTCRTERVSEFLDGRLDEAARSELTAHVQTCDRCSAELSAARRARSLLGHLAVAAPTPSASLLDRITATAWSTAPSCSSSAPRSAVRGLTIAGAAAVTVAAAATWAAAATGGAGPAVVPAVDAYRYEHLIGSTGGSSAVAPVVPVSLPGPLISPLPDR